MASKPSERFVWAGDTLALDPADRVLEVGCGHGVAARRNREHIAGGRAVLRTAALETADLGNERFDKVFAFNVAHLLAVAAGGPGIVGRHLAPDGAVYLFWDA